MFDLEDSRGVRTPPGIGEMGTFSRIASSGTRSSSSSALHSASSSFTLLRRGRHGCCCCLDDRLEANCSSEEKLGLDGEPILGETLEPLRM